MASVPEFCYLAENSEGQCPADTRGYAAWRDNQSVVWFGCIQRHKRQTIMWT